MACKCIDQVSGTILESMREKCAAKKETIQEINTWNGEGLLGQTMLLSDDNQLCGNVMKTDFVFRTTFTKKDGSESKPRPNHVAIVFTYCPFCGVKYKEEKLDSSNPPNGAIATEVQ